MAIWETNKAFGFVRSVFRGELPKTSPQGTNTGAWDAAKQAAQGDSRNMPLIMQAYFNASSEVTRLRRLERGRQYLRNGEYVYPSGDFQGLPEGIINSDGYLYLSGGGIKPIGNIAPLAVNAGFAYTATDSSIHWFWDGTNGSSLMVIRRADGTKFPIPPGDLNITGLNPSTRYYFLPYWNTHGDSCTISWVTGTVGAPLIAFSVNTDIDSLQQQNLQGREQLWGGYLYADTAAGGGSGGGGGGGGGCVMHGNTDVEPLAGDAICMLKPETNWVRLTLANGHSLNCTPDHPVFSELRGKIEAKDAQDGERMITKWGFVPLVCAPVPFVRQCLKEQWEVPSGHAMWCNGFLSHNNKMAV